MSSFARTMVAIALAGTLGVCAIAWAQTMKLQPGMWEYISTSKSVEMPGQSPAFIKRMVPHKSETVRRCLTAAQAAQGPLTGMKSNPVCAIRYQIQAGGKFSSTMRCKDAGSSFNMVSTGTISPVAFMSTSRINITGGLPTTMTGTMSGRRLGECKG